MVMASFLLGLASWVRKVDHAHTVTSLAFIALLSGHKNGVVQSIAVH